MQLTIHHSDRALRISELKKLPMQRLASDWYEQALNFRVEFTLALDATYLHFAAHVGLPAYCRSDVSSGQFVEGLWEQDVAELFLADDASEAYQEFNLSPAGAWWSTKLSSYRVRDTAQDCASSSVVTDSLIQTDGWLASLSIPRDALKVSTTLGPHSRGNVTFITHKPQQRFITAASLQSEKPDFHLAAQFVPFQVRVVR